MNNKYQSNLEKLMESKKEQEIKETQKKKNILNHLLYLAVIGSIEGIQCSFSVDGVPPIAPWFDSSIEIDLNLLLTGLILKYENSYGEAEYLSMSDTESTFNDFRYFIEIRRQNRIAKEEKEKFRKRAHEIREKAKEKLTEEEIAAFAVLGSH